MLFHGVAIFYKVLYLILQFVVTTIESWYLTLFPKKEKSLEGEIILMETSEDSPINCIDWLPDEMEISEDSPINCIDWLPNEILIKIIAYLPLRDRKSTRLVCKRWFGLNNDREISNREALYCYGHSDRSLDVVLEIIEKSQRNKLHLEFIELDFSVDQTRSLLFWENNGSRIESLTLRNCRLSEHTLPHVIEYCDRMRYLAILNPRWNVRCCKNCQKLTLGANLKGYRPLLHSIKLKDKNNGWISNNFLQLLFDIHPNIEHFSFMCQNSIRGDQFTFLKNAIEKEKATFASILKKLVDSRERMKSINLKSCRFRKPMVTLQTAIMRYDFPKLTDLKNVYLILVTEHEIYNFLPRHNQLRDVKFIVEISRSKEDEALVGRLMNCLMDSCTQLQSLKVEVSQDLYLLDRNIFKKIKDSNLRSLALNFKMNFRKRDRSPMNNSLKYLHLSAYYDCNISLLDRNMIKAFMQTFCGLTELIIDGPGLSDSSLQYIFHYQRQLTSLKLRNDYDVPTSRRLTAYGFTGIPIKNGQRAGCSIKNLQKLESLVLHTTDVRYPKRILEELKFLNVISLSLSQDFQQSLAGEDLVRIFSHLSNLEALKFLGDNIRCCAWLRICKQLKKLRFLVLESCSNEPDESEFSDERCVLFFENCPTLRILDRAGGDAVPGWPQYNLDTVLGKVRKAKEPHEKLVPCKMLDSGSIAF